MPHHRPPNPIRSPLSGPLVVLASAVASALFFSWAAAAWLGAPHSMTDPNGNPIVAVRR